MQKARNRPCYKTVTVKHEIVILLNVKREKYEILFYFDFFELLAGFATLAG